MAIPRTDNLRKARVVGGTPAPFWLKFIQRNTRWLVGIFLVFFFSAFGQSYVVSLNFEEIKSIHGFTDGDLGLINTVATFVSGGLVLVFGGLADRFSARLMIAASLPILGVAAFLYQLDTGPWAFFLALFLLRFAAHGLMTHVAFTLVGRWFEASRGRAVAITSAGQTIGQMVVPFGFVAIGAAIGWQLAWVTVSAVLIAITPFVVALFWVERDPDVTPGMTENRPVSNDHVRDYTRREALADPFFYAVLAGIVPMSLIANTIFFYQTTLVQFRDWDLAYFTSFFGIMAALTIPTTFVAGWLVDRYRSTTFLPLYLIPLAVACMILGWVEAAWSVPVFMALMGIANGFSLTLFGSVWPEVYGRRHLGAIRSVVVMVMICGTAVGPGVVGVLLDHGVSINTAFGGLGLLCCAISAAISPGAVSRSRNG
ncbi:MFS transporter [Ruegeria arenilitoris]|uniref:MFS transporter n=1 Tax=Ruegeria arenilitoris TaxID=1173585 RepID=UPI00147A889F|nr:MFS transporter [Ruegeria arenilitoris]